MLSPSVVAAGMWMTRMPSSLKNVLSLYSSIKKLSVGSAPNGACSLTILTSTFSWARTAAPSEESPIVPATFPPE